eukprot:jgi/Tetstr1/462173/TSEL_007238.t1
MRYGVKYTAVPRATAVDRFERSLLGDIQRGLTARDAAWHNTEPGQKGPLRDILDMSEYTGAWSSEQCVAEWIPAGQAGNVLDGGFMALRGMRKQLKILKTADEEAREALAQWVEQLKVTRTALHNTHSGCQVARLCAIACGIEEGAFLLDSMTAPFVPSLLFDHEEEDGNGQGSRTCAKVTIDELAEEVLNLSPALFRGPNGSSPGRIEEQVHAINDVLFGKYKYKSLPVEWVYDGLSPLLLSEVVDNRSGIPLCIAILYQAVARRLNVAAVLCQATQHHNRDGMGEQSSLSPDPDKWLLVLPKAGENEEIVSAWVVDPSRKGQMMSLETSQSTYPQMAVPDYSGGGVSLILDVYAEMARTVMIAHQRRGESEAVASWLYQVLALDSEAPEWEYIEANFKS